MAGAVALVATAGERGAGGQTDAQRLRSPHSGNAQDARCPSTAATSAAAPVAANTEKNKSRRHGENQLPCLRVSGISAFERRRRPATTGDAAIFKPRRAYLFLWRCAFIRLSYLCFDIFLRRFFLMEPIAFSFSGLLFRFEVVFRKSPC